jgi:Sec-independent protein translocase protein TatA
MRNLGRGIRQFKDATQGIQRDLQDGVNNIKTEIEKHANVIEEKAKETSKEIE